MTAPGGGEGTVCARRRGIARLERPSPEVLYRDYISRNAPVVLTGVADGWKAVSRWTPDYFKASFPDARVTHATWDDEGHGDEPAVYLRNRKTAGIRLGDYVDLMRGRPDPRDYLLSFPIFRHLPQLRDDVEPLDRFMMFPAYYPEALRNRLKESPRFFLGPAGTVSLLHFDGYNNFFVQVYGRKKFLLISPSQSHLVYYPWRYPDIHYSPVNVERPDLVRFPLFGQATIFEAVVGPGEILFIPVRWWHHARALEESISLNFWWYSLPGVVKLCHPLLMYGKGKAVNFLKRRTARLLKRK